MSNSHLQLSNPAGQCRQSRQIQLTGSFLPPLTTRGGTKVLAESCNTYSTDVCTTVKISVLHSGSNSIQQITMQTCCRCSCTRYILQDMECNNSERLMIYTLDSQVMDLYMYFGIIQRFKRILQ